MEILEMRNTITEVSSSVDELSRRMELTEERIRKHAHRGTELTSSKQQRKSRLDRRGEQSLGTRGTLAEGLTHVIRAPEGEGREDWVQRIKNGGGNFPKFGKRCNSLQTPDRKKNRETDTKTHHVKPVKTKDRENHLGSSDGKTPPYL